MHLAKIKQYVSPRALQFANNLLLIVMGIFLFDLQRTFVQIFSCLGIALVTEYLFVKYLQNKRFTFEKAQSTLVTSIGVLLVIYSTSWAFYCLAAVLAISSKYFLKKNSEDHIFNPANFGLVASICLMSPGVAKTFSDQFVMAPYIFWQVLIVGLFVTFLVKRWVLVFSYMFLFAGFSYLFTVFGFTPFSFYEMIGPEIGTGALIYLFFMITDPRTSPHNAKAQFLWAGLIAFLAVSFRSQEIHYSRFIALFIATLLTGIYQVSTWAVLKRAEAKTVAA